MGTVFQGQEAAALLLAAVCPATAPAGICVSRDLPPASQGKELWQGLEPGLVLRPLLHPPAPSSPSGCRLPSSLSPAILLPLNSLASLLSCHQQNLLSEASSLRFLGEFSHLPVSPGGKEATRFLEGRTGLPTLPGCRPGVWWGGWTPLQTFLTDLVSSLIGFHIKPLSSILS